MFDKNRFKSVPNAKSNSVVSSLKYCCLNFYGCFGAYVVNIDYVR